MKTFNILSAAILLMVASACCQTPAQSDENNSDAVIENIMARRSIRKYKDIPEGRDTMNVILECGINAPNGQNRQSWEVRVVDNPATMDAIKEAMAQGHPNMKPEAIKGCFRDAPVMVFIARDPSYDFSAYDCGLLAENMMLSAWSMGIGSVCLGGPARFMTDNAEAKEYLNQMGFSENYDLLFCIGFGYPAETPAAKPRDKGKVKFID